MLMTVESCSPKSCFPTTTSIEGHTRHLSKCRPASSRTMVRFQPYHHNRKRRLAYPPTCFRMMTRCERTIHLIIHFQSFPQNMEDKWASVRVYNKDFIRPCNMINIHESTFITLIIFHILGIIIPTDELIFSEG